MLGECFRVLGVGFSSNYGRGFLFHTKGQSSSPLQWSIPVVQYAAPVQRIHIPGFLSATLAIKIVITSDYKNT